MFASCSQMKRSSLSIPTKAYKRPPSSTIATQDELQLHHKQNYTLKKKLNKDQSKTKATTDHYIYLINHPPIPSSLPVVFPV